MKLQTRAKHSANVIEALEVLGPCTLYQVEKMTKINIRTLTRLMEDLAQDGLVHAQHLEKGTHWVLGARKGVASKSARYAPQGTYKPPVWNPDVARPGANDFLKVPSLMGTKRVEHRPSSNACVSSVRGVF